MHLRESLVPGLVLLTIMISCQTDGPSHMQTRIPYHTLIVTDSIGLEHGDPMNIFGRISGVHSHPEGGVLLLDSGKNILSLYIPGGDIQALASQGEGPGEFLRASEMALSGEEILVLDRGKRRILRFSNGGDFLGEATYSGVPEVHSIWGRGNGNLIAILIGMEPGDANQMSITVDVSDFDPNSGEASSMYHQSWLPPYNGIYRFISDMEICAGADGPTFLCLDTSEYLISIIGDSGNIIGTIQRDDVPRVPLTQEEISEAERVQEERLQGQFIFQGRNDPNPYRSIIQLAGVDSLGRLWVSRAIGEDSLHFDVWNQEGTLVEEAGLQWESSREPVKARIDQGGRYLVTTNNSSVVRVYIID